LSPIDRNNRTLYVRINRDDGHEVLPSTHPPQENLMKRIFPLTLAVGTVVTLIVTSFPAGAQTAKAGAACRKVGEVKNGLTCTQDKKNKKKRTYQKVAAPTTVAAAPGATVAAAPAGLATVPGFDGKTISIGYLGNVSINDQFPASRSFSDGGKALTAGFNSYVERINEKGGVAGKYKINVVFKETYYTPSEAVKAYAEIKNQVVMFGQLYGTPLAQALDKSLGEDNLVASPISLDAAWVRNPNFLPVGATYQAQAINVIDYYLKEGGGKDKKVCSVALANNAFGVAGEEGFDFAVKELKFNAGPKVKWAGGAPAGPIVQQLKDANCDAVLATLSGEGQTPLLLSEGAKLNYTPQILMVSPSFASRSVTQANSGAFGKQGIVAADGTAWYDVAVPGTKQMQDDLRKYAPEQLGTPNPANQWGYAQAKTVVALLEKAVADGDLSKAGIRKSMSTLGTVKQDGMYPEWNYGDPAKRVAPSGSNIYKVDISQPGGLEFVKAFNSPAAQAYK
jgi:Periplasmic binding protein